MSRVELDHSSADLRRLIGAPHITALLQVGGASVRWARRLGWAILEKGGHTLVLNHRQTPEHSYGIAPPGFRLPDTTHLGTVHLQVSNLQRSVDYYEQVIGLRTCTLTTDSAILGTHLDDCPLVWLQTRTGVEPARRGTFGLYHLAILLPERAALGRFAAHLSALSVRFGMADHLVSEALYLWDPDGLGIEVYADRPRNTWQLHDRELAMTTDSLDIKSVVAAGGGGSWDGAPTGAKMGHVHLNVGSLDAAEAFYHQALGFDKTVWSYPGALFFSAGGYHHHLATNTWSPGPSPPENQARLLQWELIVPAKDDALAAGRSLRAAGYEAEDTADGIVTTDPWETRVGIRTKTDVRTSSAGHPTRQQPSP